VIGFHQKKLPGIVWRRSPMRISKFRVIRRLYRNKRYFGFSELLSRLWEYNRNDVTISGHRGLSQRT
jgi:hypothetical protein